jgi:hypothetical protein
MNEPHAAPTRGGQAGTNYTVPAIRKGARGPTMLHTFLSFSVVSDVIRL